ncbi:centromere protein S-like [Nilaparvata lugens]|uniref:centromere protein S-like n=1 Tax=Nilaparvata lugens TaxID=108931 RepID=UPI00193CC0A4|nr:centromere protein S-like [Nilaparvata lugens]
MIDNPDLLTTEEKLKLSLYHTVSKICHQTGQDNSVVGEFSFSKDANELISELIWKKLESFSLDLELFAKNRKQSTINIEDIRLLVRKNASMKEHVDNMILVNGLEKKQRSSRAAEPSTSTELKQSDDS